MKRTFLLLIAVLILPSLACSITLPTPPQVQTGPTQIFTVSAAQPDLSADKAVDVSVRMGAGELKLQGGADGLAEGDIEYNVADWKPTVTQEDGKLIIEQGHSSDNLTVWLPNKDNQIVNRWDLKLGAAPMNLTLTAGAYNGALDLSGLHLRNLTINDGASDSEVTFDAANPETMDKFTYETGASTIRLNGLGYANFKQFNFKGGAGDYKLDFAGELKQDATVVISAGMSSIQLTIPASTPATVEVAGGIKNVKTEGTWTANEDTYQTTATSGHTLTIKVEIGMGTLTLVSKK